MSIRYLDPRNDFAFKKIFGNHPNILKSFLNALLPLDEDNYIVDLEYLPTELVPVAPVLKNSIVDVRCIDSYGRQFLVEMEMFWTNNFTSRVVFNASKAYVKQIDKGVKYDQLKEVYALSILNDVFLPKKEEFYHHYSIVNRYDTNERIEGMEFIFIELPKFKPTTFSDKRLQILWLRFLTEIKDHTEDEEIFSELKEVEEISDALEVLRESSFSKLELDAYDRYWDAIRKEVTLHEGKMKEGFDRGLKQGIEQGIEKGIEQAIYNIIENCYNQNLEASMASTLSGKTIEEVEEIYSQLREKNIS